MEPIIGQGQSAQSTAPKGSAAQDVVKDTTERDFTADVLEGSMQQPVIVDFWAPWCGPCKTLTPILENAVRAHGGKVKLIKLNIDEAQSLAAQLRIQSIPMVYAFYQGRPVDGFQGAQQESYIKQWVQQLADMAGDSGEQQKEAVNQALEQARGALDAGEVATAQSIYGKVLQLEEGNAEALAGLIRCQTANGDTAGAREIYDGLDDETKKSNEVEAAYAAIELAEQSAQAAGDVMDLQEKIAHDPDDLQSRYDLALALNAAGKREAACEQLLEIIKRDRSWEDEAARKQLVKFFEAWGHADPVTQSARRKLSAVLFS
jgi:putative thioredoxin